MLKDRLRAVRELHPLVHNITNYVTVNDCANILLACGASPIMADAPEEAAQITARCGGLNLNLGTLNRQKIPAMLAAGKTANALGHPVVLDPVGVGASDFRRETAAQLLAQIRFDAIRGNISEIRTLAGTHGTGSGVDADVADTVTEENLPQTVAFAKAFSRKTGAVIIMTGAIDIVADGETACCIFNGHPMMGSVTGTGCQLSAMTAAYLTANPAHKLEAAVAAVCAMGICGEIAYERMAPQDGSGSYRVYLMDAVWNLDGETLEGRAKYQMMGKEGDFQ